VQVEALSVSRCGEERKRAEGSEMESVLTYESDWYGQIIAGRKAYARGRDSDRWDVYSSKKVARILAGFTVREG